MNLFPAQPFDIDSIMKIERQAFIPQIQEKKKTFEKRLEIFSNGFLILSDSSEKVVKENGNALTCGYLCSEIWDSFPLQTDSDEIFSRKFKLGHNIKETHSQNGSYLYISSFALLRDYQGHGLGCKFFESSVAALCGSFQNVKKVVLLVNEEWQNALKIYKSLGFEEIKVLKEFFPSLNSSTSSNFLKNLFSKSKQTFSNAIVMTCDAQKFREINFENNTENEFSSIKL